MKSIAAMQNITALCEEHLPGSYSLEVLDVLDDPQIAERDKLLAVPMLVRLKPAPVRRIVGDLSDTEVVTVALNLPLAPGPSPLADIRQRSSN
jgi:circadian clock protein KaiB